MSFLMSYKPVYILLLVFGFFITGTVSAQCTGCTQMVSSNTSVDINVNSGATVCIAANVRCSGKVTMKGGTLCNLGTIDNLVLNNGNGGTINNYKTITNVETVSKFNENLTINNYPGSTLSFSSNDFFQAIATTVITFNQYNGSVVNMKDVSMTAGNMVISNGKAINGSDGNPVTTITSFNIGNGSFTDAALTITNTATGKIILAGSLNLNNSKAKSIVNNGEFDITNSLNVAGNASSTTTSILNTNIFSISTDLNSSISNGSFVFTNGNSGTAGLTAQTTVSHFLKFDTGTSSFINNGTTNAGYITLNLGTITNNSIFNIDQKLYNVGGTYNNNGAINITNSFENKSTMNFTEKSTMITTDYLNLTGIIHGPSSLSNSAYSFYPAITMRGHSENSGIMDGYFIVFDQSLDVTTSNNGFGFDVVNNTSNIGTNVKYAATSKGNGSPDINCALLQTNLTVSSTGLQVSCPGAPSGLSAQLHSLGSNVGATYVWQPGNITAQNTTVTPNTTTIYTVTATAFGCSYTQTISLSVYPYDIPAISYANTTTLTLPATFPVTQTGITGGTFSFATPPECSGITINSSTGAISLTNTACFGTYVVKYCVNLPENPIKCGIFCTTTTVTLVDARCSLTTTPVSLCPDDKATLIVTGSSGTYAWSPSTGLSCANCPSPVLTMDDSGARQYVVTATQNGLVCGTATLSVQVKTNCQNDDIIGCCFGNYGTNVYVGPNTFLNIYCNLINEQASSAQTVSYGSTLHGKFEDEQGATIRVLLDWIHNAKNALYIPATTATHAGTTIVFGDDQKLRGNSSTEFNELRLEGSGTKSLFVNQSGYSTLNLNDLILNVRNSTYAMKTPTTDVIRTTGYVSNSNNGYFSWIMQNGNPHRALYPLGAKATSTSSFKYRPLTLSNNVITLDEISANFINTAPAFSYDADFISQVNPPASDINVQAPNVAQINHAFYHKIKKTVPAPLAPVSNINIQYYYKPIDGVFQSISEWEKRSATQSEGWWGSTPGPAVGPTSADGMMSAVANGTFTFNHKPITLARSGFYLNTNAFGDGIGSSTGIGNTGTSISLSATSLGPGIPSGGGIGNSFGTGSTSGNTGNGGNTIFTPSPVTGRYVMTIAAPNSCVIPGRIKFDIDANGNVDPASVEYGDSTTAAYYGSLSEGLYTIDAVNAGITFSATPQDLMRACVNAITVKTSSGDFVLDQAAAETVDIVLPTGFTFSAFSLVQNNVTPGSNNLLVPALSSGSHSYNLGGPAIPGPYTFSFTITQAGAPSGTVPMAETITGQLIIK